MWKLTLALSFAVSAFAQLEVAVHIHNNAGVAGGDVNQAMRIASRLFAPVGVSLRWLNCEAGCEPEAGVPAYILGLVGAAVEMPLPEALGFSMLATGSGNRGAVSLPRIADYAEANGIPMAAVLAHSIAHELGHMITRSKAHSRGVMQGKWDKESALRMGQSRMQFAAIDVAAMKAALRAKAMAPQAVE